VTRDTISKFNRDTLWLATGVLGTVVFAALMLAFQERQPKAAQAEGDLLLNANPARVSSVIAKSSNVNGEMTPRAGSGVDTEFTENSCAGKSFLTEGIRSFDSNCRSRVDT